MTTMILALDFQTRDEALRMLDRVGDACDYCKVGSELFTAAGPAFVRELRARDVRVFLDLKFHDIPNTVSGALRAASALDVAMVTVHAVGGAAMIRAAASVANRPSIVAVTGLTSLTSTELAASWGRESGSFSMGGELERLAVESVSAGADGVVCSAAEARGISGVLGRLVPAAIVLVPGIRLEGDDSGDQRRTATPREAVSAGATHLVLGRTVTGHADPGSRWAEAVASLG